MKKQYIILIGAAALVLIYFMVSFIRGDIFKMDNTLAVTDSTWIAPSIYTDNTVSGEERKLVIYGQDLIAHTAKYLGPKGSVAQITNGMNCQNCHLQAGGKAWGNNYAAVFSTYPKFRDRSGQVESIYKRVADCMERSLNGTAVDSNSREFKAIYAYIKWIGQDVQKGQKPHGSGIEKLAYLDRAADPIKGKQVYTTQCMSCHGANGEGQLAYVNSQPRPHKDQSNDWPKYDKKPLDFAFGPYADDFSETQHKYGPFKPIQKFYKK